VCVCMCMCMCMCVCVCVCVCTVCVYTFVSVYELTAHGNPAPTALHAHLGRHATERAT